MIGNTSTYTLDGTSLSLLVQGTAGSSTHYGVIGSYRQANSVGFGTGYGMFFNNSASVAKLYAYFNGFIESATAGSENGGLSFWTRRSGTLTEAMRIIGSGKVGIGTPTPSTQFEIYGTTAGISLTRI